MKWFANETICNWPPWGGHKKKWYAKCIVLDSSSLCVKRCENMCEGFAHRSRTMWENFCLIWHRLRLHRFNKKSYCLEWYRFNKIMSIQEKSHLFKKITSFLGTVHIFSKFAHRFTTWQTVVKPKRYVKNFATFWHRFTQTMCKKGKTICEKSAVLFNMTFL